MNECCRKAVEEVHKEIAMKQTLVHGEGVMLGGKVVTNEELYKQPVDYIREAKAEAYEDAAKIAEDFCGCDAMANEGYLCRACRIAKAIRAEVSGNSGALPRDDDGWDGVELSGL